MIESETSRDTYFQVLISNMTVLGTGYRPVTPVNVAVRIPHVSVLMYKHNKLQFFFNQENN
jgi:hypothetical protein